VPRTESHTTLNHPTITDPRVTRKTSSLGRSRTDTEYRPAPKSPAPASKDFDEYVKALRQSRTPEQRDKADEKRPKPVPSAGRCPEPSRSNTCLITRDSSSGNKAQVARVHDAAASAGALIRSLSAPFSVSDRSAVAQRRRCGTLSAVRLRLLRSRSAVLGASVAPILGFMYPPERTACVFVCRAFRARRSESRSRGQPACRWHSRSPARSI
jgi:hypothetical protein